MSAPASSPSTGARHGSSPPPYSRSSSEATDSSVSIPHMSGADPPTVDSSSAGFTGSSTPIHPQYPSSSPSTSSSAAYDPSTAPTTPALDGPRTWRHTPNVPPYMAQRRSRRIALDNEEQERNRWLSEDEGLEGVPRATRRRRRRRHGSADRPPGPPGSGNEPGPGPSSQSASTARVKATRRAHSDKVVRPVNRRTRSFDQPAAGPSTHAESPPESAVGAAPPRIEDLLSSVNSVVGLGVSTNEAGSSRRRIEQPKEIGVVPDFIDGHSDDGIGSVSFPSSGINANLGMSNTSSRESQRELVDKLRRALGCALCPPRAGTAPPLHQPITLPCGHTLSAEHISIPAPPRIVPASSAPHDVFAAEQKQHQARLALWCGVMCPIPTCKRYSPSASVEIYSDIPTVDIFLPDSQSTGGEAIRAATLPSGVTYYPSALPPPPPAYTLEATASESGPPLLDVCVDKILDLVLHEIEDPSGETSSRSMREASHMTDTDTEGDEPPLPHSVRMSRQSSKRRRNPLRADVSVPRPNSSPDGDWPFRKRLLGLLECDVCAMLLHEPVTTPCQHSFCSKCLSRALDHSSRCPLCRQDLPSFAFFQDHAVNKVLLTTLKIAFADEYAERTATIERDERDARLDTPIFVCTLAFPGMPTILHVFEPRYRLMIRRCIESSSPRFGMILPSRTTAEPGSAVIEYGTMLEIQSVQMLPDGRSMVETVGTHRFKLLERGNLDGYTVGRIERIDDVSPAEELAMEQEIVLRAQLARSSGSSIPPPIPAADTALMSNQGPQRPAEVTSAPSDDLPKTTEEYMALCRSFIDQLRSGSAPWLLQRLNNTYGSMPEDPSEFSYWMALIMPIDEYEKARLLPIRSPRLRLKLIVHWVESLRSSWWFSSGVRQILAVLGHP